MISCIVPNKNYGHFIEKCLASIKFQTYKNFEVLICDSNSCDNSLNVINRFVETDERFKLFSQSDKSQAEVLNRAFSQAQGTVFCYLNSDDYYINNQAFDLATKSLKQYDCVSFQSQIKKNNKKPKLAKNRYQQMFTKKFYKRRTHFVQPSSFWSRELGLAIPFNEDLSYTFDTLFYYQLRSSNYKFKEDCSVTTSEILLHGNNKSLTFNIKRFDEIISFETLKYGEQHYRVSYLKALRSLFKNQVNKKKFLKTVINLCSYASFFLLPSN